MGKNIKNLLYSIAIRVLMLSSTLSLSSIIDAQRYFPSLKPIDSSALQRAIDRVEHAIKMDSLSNLMQDSKFCDSFKYKYFYTDISGGREVDLIWALPVYAVISIRDVFMKNTNLLFCHQGNNYYNPYNRDDMLRITNRRLLNDSLIRNIESFYTLKANDTIGGSHFAKRQLYLSKYHELLYFLPNGTAYKYFISTYHVPPLFENAKYRYIIVANKVLLEEVYVEDVNVKRRVRSYKLKNNELVFLESSSTYPKKSLVRRRHRAHFRMIVYKY